MRLCAEKLYVCYLNTGSWTHCMIIIDSSLSYLLNFLIHLEYVHDRFSWIYNYLIVQHVNISLASICFPVVSTCCLVVSRMWRQTMLWMPRKPVYRKSVSLRNNCLESLRLRSPRPQHTKGNFDVILWHTLGLVQHLSPVASYCAFHYIHLSTITFQYAAMRFRLNWRNT